ncbi:uncharacterized protein LOC110994018 [Pieris rapae]|uniref:uncharacterized protein LOC110994018 n=1 Tax=Pieris rapae TaxID=64459 RepID=UPI001E27F757|nr:uncharacterized protein LOC110994018 [Pieris rapae]
MNLRIICLLAVFLSRSVASQANDEIKKGKFPFMAFIYYPDDSVVDKNGVRLTRAGILLKPDRLITSSLETDDEPMAFPEKTLVARLGSISIDSNFSINEDEDEQEREIIQIIRPYNFSATEWWLSDISLLKTLIPFNLTTAVAYTSIYHKSDIIEKDCFSLVYARNPLNKTMDKLLTLIPVEVVPSSTTICGSHYRENTMVCAQDLDDKKNVTYDPNFCIGNGGGPLVCENNICGIQTYSNGCHEPYLYQVFSGWVLFISCGIQDTCQEKQCEKICTVINKDERSTTKQQVALVSQEITTREITQSTSDSENDSEEISPERPTATAAKDFDDTTLTSTSILVEDSPETSASAETQSLLTETSGSVEEKLRRTNVEAQKQPIKKKKNSAAILTPFSTQLPILFWVAINFA